VKKSLFVWFVLLVIGAGCNLPQPSQRDVPTLEFPNLRPTYTQPPAFPTDTPAPEIITATPATPSPTPATVSLKKIAKWSHAEAYEVLWNLKFGRFVVVSERELTSYLIADTKKDWSIMPENKDGAFRAASLSTNGNVIVTFNTGPALYQFDAKTGELIEKKRVLEECGDAILRQSVYLSNGMKELFTAAQSDKITAPVEVRKWGIAPYHCDLVGSVTGGSLSALLISPDERFVVLVASKGLTGQVTAWNATDGKKVCTLQGVAAAFHPDGRLAVADMQKSALVYWRVDSCQVSSELPWVGYEEPQQMTFTPNGKYLLTFRHGIQVWDPTTAGLLWERNIPEAIAGGLLRISADSKYLLSITNPGALNAQIDFWSIVDK